MPSAKKQRVSESLEDYEGKLWAHQCTADDPIDNGQFDKGLVTYSIIEDFGSPPST